MDESGQLIAYHYYTVSEILIKLAPVFIIITFLLFLLGYYYVGPKLAPKLTPILAPYLTPIILRYSKWKDDTYET